MPVQKISEMTAIVGSNTATDDVFLVVDTSTNTTKKITRSELNNAIEQDILASIDITTANIDGGTIDGATIGGSSAGAGTFTSLQVNNNCVITGDLTVTGDDITMGTNTAVFYLFVCPQSTFQICKNLCIELLSTHCGVLITLFKAIKGTLC